MSDFLEVHCPSCGRNQIFSTAGVAREGAWGNCAGCGDEIFVTPDGSEVSGGARLVDREPTEPAQAAIAMAATPPETATQHDGRIHLKMATGKVESLSSEAIEHGIQSGNITPWDLVANDGETFEAISRHHLLRDFFVEGDFTVRLQSRCHQHRERLPEQTCRRCGRSYCSECSTSASPARHGRCLACDGVLEKPDPRLTEVPPWKRLKDVAMFPIEGAGWVITLLLAVILWLGPKSLVAAPLLALGLGIIVFILDRSSRGERTLRLNLGSDVQALAKTAIPAIIVSLLVALPLLITQRYLSSSVGTLLLFAMGIAAFAYYPMALGQLTLRQDKQTALDPKRVVAAIVALKEEYLLCLTLLLIGGVAAFGVQTLAGLVPGIGSVLGGLARAYGLVIVSYLLGWSLYMNRERILAAR